MARKKKETYLEAARKTGLVSGKVSWGSTDPNWKPSAKWADEIVEWVRNARKSS